MPAWHSSWHLASMWYDLQRSLKDQPVVWFLSAAQQQSAHKVSNGIWVRTLITYSFCKLAELFILEWNFHQDTHAALRGCLVHIHDCIKAHSHPGWCMNQCALCWSCCCMCMWPASFPTDKTLSEFTGMISTSNHIMDDIVIVETDADVIWVTETALWLGHAAQSYSVE